MIRPPRRLGPLEERPFRLLWVGQTLSAAGDALVPVALAFAVLGLTGSATDLGLVLAASFVARVVFLLAGGVWADRLPRRRVMLAADVFRAAVHAAIAVLLLTGSVEVWHLIVAGALTGIASAFFTPASTGVVPETVSAARLQQANALMSISRRSVAIFGPAASGVLVAAFGPGWVFALEAASFFVSAAFLAALPLRATPPAVRRAFLRELGEGWREVRSRTWVWAGLLCFSLSNVAVATFFVLGPVVADRELGGAADWGLVLTGGAVGGVLGGVVAIRFRPRHPLRVAFPVIVLCALQLVALVPPLPVLALAVTGALALGAIDLANALWTTVLQERIPRHQLSRVSAYDWMVSYVFMPVGYTVAGPLAGELGVDATLALAAALCAMASVGMLAIPSVRNLPRVSSDTAPRPTSGPEREPEAQVA